MEMYATKPNSPWVSLGILIGLVFACSIGAQLIFLLGYLFFSGDLASFLQGSNTGPENMSLGLRYLLFMVSSVGTFLLPAIFLQMIEKKQFDYFTHERYNFLKLFLLAGLFLICFNPIMGLVSDWNMNMKLPESMSGLESWMRQKEDEMAHLTESVVMTDSGAKLFLNILVIAIFPAIAEEFFFRGALQGIISRWFNNYHVAIWISAIVFSAIHFQFYGFFPRVLLGAFFGYMLVWSHNIWIPVFAHFVNNAFVVVIAFIYAREGKTYAQLMADTDYHFSLYFIGLVASVAVGWYFYSLSLKKKTIDGTRLG